MNFANSLSFVGELINLFVFRTAAGAGVVLLCMFITATPETSVFQLSQFVRSAYFWQAAMLLAVAYSGLCLIVFGRLSVNGVANRASGVQGAVSARCVPVDKGFEITGHTSLRDLGPNAFQWLAKLAGIKLTAEQESIAKTIASYLPPDATINEFIESCRMPVPAERNPRVAYANAFMPQENVQALSHLLEALKDIDRPGRFGRMRVLEDCPEILCR